MFLRKNLLLVIIIFLNSNVEMISTESFNSSFLQDLKKCFETKNDDICKEKILLTERMQLREYYNNNLKCQTSILGLQTELIRNIYFEKNKNNISWKTIPSLIKNC